MVYASLCAASLGLSSLSCLARLVFENVPQKQTKPNKAMIIVGGVCVAWVAVWAVVGYFSEV